MGLPQIFYDALLQLRAGLGLVERKELVAGSLRRVIKLDLDLDPDGGLAVGDDGLALDLTAVLPVVYSAGEISVRSGSDATALYLVRRDASGIISQNFNSNAATLFVGAHLQNTAAAVLDNQRWSPALEFTAAGWNTVGSTSSAHHLYEQWCTVQGATSTGEWRISTQLDSGSVTTRFTISSTGVVTIPGRLDVPHVRNVGSLQLESTGGSIALMAPGSSLTVTDGAIEAIGQWVSETETKTFAATTTFNWDDGNVQQVTLTDNVTFAHTNKRAGATYWLIVRQDGVGGKVATWAAADKFVGGQAVGGVLSVVASAIDLFVGVCTDGTEILWTAHKGFSV